MANDGREVAMKGLLEVVITRSGAVCSVRLEGVCTYVCKYDWRMERANERM